MIEFQKWYIYPKFTFLSAQVIKQPKLFPAQITTHKRKFLELENVDIDRVVEGSKFKSKDEHFKTSDDMEHKEDNKQYHINQINHLVKTPFF